jgi:hypothetical protein
MQFLKREKLAVPILRWPLLQKTIGLTKGQGAILQIKVGKIGRAGFT